MHTKNDRDAEEHKLAKFAAVLNILATVQKFFSTVNRKVHCANFFFLLCKKVSLSEISASRKISRGGPITSSKFFFVHAFRHLGFGTRTFFRHLGEFLLSPINSFNLIVTKAQQ